MEKHSTQKYRDRAQSEALENAGENEVNGARGIQCAICRMSREGEGTVEINRMEGRMQ